MVERLPLGGHSKQKVGQSWSHGYSTKSTKQLTNVDTPLIYSQTSLIRPSLIQLFANPAKNNLEQIFPN